MTEFVSAYSDDTGNTIVSVSADHAKGAGLTVLKSEPALDRAGLPLPPREGNRTTAKKAASTTPIGGSAASKPEEATK